MRLTSIKSARAFQENFTLMNQISKDAFSIRNGTLKVIFTHAQMAHFESLA